MGVIFIMFSGTWVVVCETKAAVQSVYPHHEWLQKYNQRPEKMIAPITNQGEARARQGEQILLVENGLCHLSFNEVYVSR